MKKVMIDTNIYSLAMKDDTSITNILRKIDLIGISTISIGELYSGFKGGNREIENKDELNIFLDSPRVVVYTVDVETSEFYAYILNMLKIAVTSIPTNDIWIAAVAFQHGYKLFSKDKHFKLIKGLIMVS